MLVMTIAEYRENTASFFAENPFYEIETDRRIDPFGNIAHVWSSYEARSSPDDESLNAAGSTRSSCSAIPCKDGEFWRWFGTMRDNGRPAIMTSFRPAST
jgi:hypothetical protein